MNKSYYLALAAVLAAATATVRAQLPPGDLPTPGLPPVVPAPNTVPPPLMPASAPVAPAVPAVPAVPVAPPEAPKIPAVPPPTAPTVPPSTAPVIPAVPPPTTIPSVPVAPPMSPSAPAVPPVSTTPPAIPSVPPPVASTPPKPLPVVPPSTPSTPTTPPVANTPPRPLPAVPPPNSIGGTTAPASVAAGRFAVLKDDKLIEGTVTVAGDKVIVRQGALDRPFAKADVQFVGNSKDDVYRFMVSKAAPTDAAARLKVAKWCLFNGMRSQALTEAREVVKLDPKNSAAVQMVRSLEESLRQFPEDGAPPAKPNTPTVAPANPIGPTNPTGPALPPVPPPSPTPSPAPSPMTTAPPKIPPVIPPAVVASPEVEPEPEIALESASVFPTRVQPILVNLCADCHAKPDHASAFKLARGTDYYPDPQIARSNLKAVAAQLNKADPAKSPLLVKSLIAHGGMKQPVLAGRHVAAYRSLEVWVYAAVGATAPAPTPAPVPVPEPIARTVPPNVPGPLLPLPGATPMAPASPVLPPVVGSFGQDAKPLTPDPVGTGAPVDDFDPSVFNRAIYPGRK